MHFNSQCNLPLLQLFNAAMQLRNLILFFPHPTHPHPPLQICKIHAKHQQCAFARLSLILCHFPPPPSPTAQKKKRRKARLAESNAGKVPSIFHLQPNNLGCWLLLEKFPIFSCFSHEHRIAFVQTLFFFLVRGRDAIAACV